MKEEHNIEKLVLHAQKDRLSADHLIEQYLPFIRSEAVKMTSASDSQEDALSIAMFAFYEAILSYRPGRGAFLKLAAKAIRNRIIDHHRKQQRHSGLLSLDMPETQDDDRTLGQQIADESADLQARQDRLDAQQEIGHFVLQLSEFGLSLTDLAENCPKQDRTMQACMVVLDHARKHPELLQQLLQTKKLPMSQLVLGAKVDKKTIERHRKYIVGILLAYTNGFEIIRGHLKQIRRKGELSL